MECILFLFRTSKEEELVTLIMFVVNIRIRPSFVFILTVIYS